MMASDPFYAVKECQKARNICWKRKSTFEIERTKLEREMQKVENELAAIERSMVIAKKQARDMLDSLSSDDPSVSGGSNDLVTDFQ